MKRADDFSPVNDDDYVVSYESTTNSINQIITKSKDNVQKATIFSAIINLCNTILGAGMLGIPFALHTTGLALGLFFIVVCGIFSAFGLYLLSITAQKLDEERPDDIPSYNAAAMLTYPKLAILIDIAIVIKCFGVATSYLIVIGDLMPDAMMDLLDIEPDSIFAARNFWITALMAINIPLSCLKSINALRFTSALALTSVVYLVAITVGYFFYYDGKMAVGEVKYVNISTEILEVLPVFVFAFTCHQNLFPIYSELSNRNLKKICIVIAISIACVFTVYFLIGIFGYLTFRECISDNIITNYDSGVIPTIGRIMITVLVVFSFPLQIFPCRYSLDKIVAECMKLAKVDTNKYISLRFWIETGCLVTFSFLISLFVTGLDIVFALVGATGSTTICYILPGIFYYKIKKEEKWDIIKLSAVVLAVLGVLLMVTCVSVIVIDAIFAAPEEVNPLCTAQF